jgi:hypothetical protein
MKQQNTKDEVFSHTCSTVPGPIKTRETPAASIASWTQVIRRFRYTKKNSLSTLEIQKPPR